MYDYDNMPSLNWSGEATVHHAKAQLLREEPVVLNMPAGFDFFVEDPEACGCALDTDHGILYNCDPKGALGALAGRNQESGVDELMDAAVESGSRVDIDVTGRRIILHD